MGQIARAQHHDSGPGRRQFPTITRIGEKAQLLRPGTRQSGHALDSVIAITPELQAKTLRQFGQGKGRAHRCRPCCSRAKRASTSSVTSIRALT